jgi:hypothetical protein
MYSHLFLCHSHFTLYSPLVNKFTIQQFYVQPTHCIYVFCADLRTNSYYFPIQHQLTGLHSTDGVCLLRGTNQIIKYSSGFSRFLKG